MPIYIHHQLQTSTPLYGCSRRKSLLLHHDKDVHPPGTRPNEFNSIDVHRISTFKRNNEGVPAMNWSKWKPGIAVGAPPHQRPSQSTSDSFNP
jgi:hypothetical protein